MLKKIIVVDYIEGAGGEYFAQFLSDHMNTAQHRWLQKYFNSQSLVTKNWDQDFEHHLNKFLELCNKQNVNEIAVPYHLYKWPHQFDLFNRIAHTVRAVKIDSTQYNREVALDFLRKIYLCPFDNTQISQLAYLANSATDKVKQELNEQLRSSGLQWIDVIITLDNTLTKRQLVDQVLRHTTMLSTQDVKIDYGVFYVNRAGIEDKYNLLCKQLDITSNLELLEELIKRNKENWDTLTQFIREFPEIYKQL